MRIAIVGGGISGLSAAWFLRDQHEITLFEKDSELGGHAHTEIVHVDGKKIPVDTAFIVLNKRNYLNLVAFFAELDVPLDQVEMVLSVSLNEGAFEWNTNVPNGVFADRTNLVRPAFWRLLAEVKRFNATALGELPKLQPHETLGKFLDRNHFGTDFRVKYFYPLTGAIWSTPGKGIEESPAKSVLSFLNNHGTLRISKKDRLDWFTVRHGSREYVQAVAKALTAKGQAIRTNTTISKIHRDVKGVRIETTKGTEEFDYVIVATHADTALKLLARPTSDEKRLLSPFAYERNEVYLHRDASFMPRRKRAWGTWVYAGEPEEPDGTKKACITYHMNALQHIDERYPLFVTLNPGRLPDPDKTYKHFTYHHPVFPAEAIHAQSQLDTLQNKNHSLFCGSYFGFGFHEDGITSAINAVQNLGVRPPWKS